MKANAHVNSFDIQFGYNLSSLNNLSMKSKKSKFLNFILLNP